MAGSFRKRSSIRFPITLSASLMTLNVTLMVCWIVVLARGTSWTVLTLGVVLFTLILVGMSFWLVLTLKEIALNNRQANFVDSVTHELKSPIAAIQLSLETLKMRNLTPQQREHFYGTMDKELRRLDELINQLLEAGRLDAVGQNELIEEIELEPLLRECAAGACTHHKTRLSEVLTMKVPPIRIRARRIVMRMIFSNLLDNAVKYGGDPPRVEVTALLGTGGRAHIRVSNNGSGVPYADRKKVFQVFYRGGSELQRRTKGTGLGLFIVSTLVKQMKGRISVDDRDDGQPGCTFTVELPGVVIPTSEIPSVLSDSST
ncbi:MAG: sensor histidine kinase [Planctomycetota bacterium]|jgi:two-component system phosphate regulon sensor histidine kinase PhoR|nr:MAG: sensor histidine kinase [Planctomycetota bacterium]